MNVRRRNSCNKFTGVLYAVCAVCTPYEMCKEGQARCASKAGR